MHPETTEHVDRIDFFVNYLVPILLFQVIFGLGIRGFGKWQNVTTANNEVRL